MKPLLFRVKDNENFPVFKPLTVTGDSACN